MAAPINQYISLRDCIFSYSEAAKQDDTRYLRLWRIAFRGYKQLGLSQFFATKKEPLPVNDNLTVTFPDDMLQWINVEPVADSLIPSFVRTNKLCKANEFRVDADNRCFVFDLNMTDSEVILEHVYAPEVDDDSNDYVIPIQFEEAMIDFISWQDVKHIPASSHFGRGDKMDRAAAFRASLQLAKRLYKPFRVSDAYIVYKQDSRITPGYN